jgi:V/A-type H+/Na+-transporting ATPase subunit I
VLTMAGLFLVRWPAARLLVAGGLSAAVFGLLFGSVFSLEHVIPALWVHPMEQPLLVLAVPLAGGVLLLALGQVLNALEASWRGALRAWCLTDAGLLALYLGIPAAFAFDHGCVMAVAGCAWYLAGSVRLEPRLIVLVRALGSLFEKVQQLVVNTLSFARVGAFALAHAGLSAAVAALMEGTEVIVFKALVLAVGNLVAIVLEGLVVSVQTTRLVLFEFFLRFLRADGRAFRPLPAPPYYLGAVNEPTH